MKTVLCYGDSNTYGLKSDLVNRFPRNVRWPGVLQEMLGNDYYIIEEGLGGRTTVWDDPVENYKNGKTYLLPCLDSHKPLDLVIVLLGTNDLKCRFNVSPFDIGNSMDNLLQCILKSDAGIDFEPPKVLVIAPVPIFSVNNPDLDQMIPEQEERSKAIIPYYKKVAEKYSVYYMDPSAEVEVNMEDGIHYTEAGHKRMAELVYDEVKKILG